MTDLDYSNLVERVGIIILIIEHPIAFALGCWIANKQYDPARK